MIMVYIHVFIILGSVAGCELSVEVDPEASTLLVGGERVESQWVQAMIVLLHSQVEMVTVTMGVIDQTGVLLSVRATLHPVPPDVS